MRISDWSSDVCSSDLRRVGLDHWTPLRVERLVRLPASDDEAVNRSVTLSLKPLLRSGFRARPDRSPEIGRLRKIGQRLLIKHHIAEQARTIRIPVHMIETRSEEHTSELQSLMRNSYAVFCLKKKKT